MLSSRVKGLICVCVCVCVCVCARARIKHTEKFTHCIKLGDRQTHRQHQRMANVGIRWALVVKVVISSLLYLLEICPVSFRETC